MEDNTMGNNIEGYNTEANGYSSDRDLVEAQVFVEKNIQLIEQKTEDLQQRNDEILQEEGVLEKVGEKVKKVSEEVTAYLGKNWRNLGRAAGIVSLLTSVVYLSGCTNKENTPPTPQIMAFEPDAMPANEDIQVQPTPTTIVEPTATETPPDVDLGWHDWGLFVDKFGGSNNITAESLEAHYETSYESSLSPVYMVFGGTKEKMFLSDQLVIPQDEESLEKGNTINYVNERLGLGLDQKGEEILKQFFLYKYDPEDWRGSKFRLYVFVDNNGCIYEKDGALTVINKTDNEQGFEVKVYKQEDIPWEEFSQEDKQKIEQGFTQVDKSGSEVVYSCNINDIISSSTDTEE